jgi:ABC-type oligopeptide transport system substrate-binding subunit
MKKASLKLAIILLALTPGCSKHMKNNSTLTVRLPVLNLTIDPHKMEDAYSMTAVLQVYRGLFRYTPQGELKPDLAMSWQESPDHKIFTFKLHDSEFSNGTPITSENVRLSFARIFALGAGIGADIDYIEGSRLFRKTKRLTDLGIKAIDTHTIQFKLERPSALFFKHLGTVDCAVLPLNAVGDELAQDENLIASGPFKIASRTSNMIKLERWRSDVLDSPNPPHEIRLILSKDPNPKTLDNSANTDSYDDDSLSSALTEKLKSNGWKQYVTEIARERFVIMHPSRASKNVRKYLASRIDSESIKAQIPVQYLTASYGLIPTGIAGELSKGDLAGYRNSIRNVSPPSKISLSLTYANDDEASPLIANALKAAWETKAIQIKLDPIDRPTLLTRMFKKDYDLILGSKGVDYPDGYSILTYFKSGYEGNYFHVNSLEIDSDLDRLVTTFNQSEREVGYRKLQLKILNEFTLIPLFFGSPSSGLWSPRVSNVPPHPMGLHTLPLETVEMK